jgi:hypothetical protein
MAEAISSFIYRTGYIPGRLHSFYVAEVKTFLALDVTLIFYSRWFYCSCRIIFGSVHRIPCCVKFTETGVFVQKYLFDLEGHIKLL